MTAARKGHLFVKFCCPTPTIKPDSMQRFALEGFDCVSVCDRNNLSVEIIARESVERKGQEEGSEYAQTLPVTDRSRKH